MAASKVMQAFFFAAALAACSSDSAFYEPAPTITGNNTGGVIPAKMAATQNVDSLAAAHCAKYGAAARVTFPASQTGGEAVFICEKGGQPAMNPQSGKTPAPTGPSVITAPKK